MTTLDRALDAAMELSFEQKQMLIEILWKRQRDERREEIAANAREAIQAFHAGELKAETIDEMETIQIQLPPALLHRIRQEAASNENLSQLIAEAVQMWLAKKRKNADLWDVLEEHAGTVEGQP